ncbi:MAG: phenylpropionate dioxygenase-like ring-hydroxylating dioxygenase large terminal subunit [Limisphaerales bacterium]|jgi:phenylpropionate dioxygenase-like ring-hydroxylating dioxygenase large terminal subunit
MDQALQVEILKELMEQLDQGKNIDAGVQYKMPTTSYVCPEIAAREQAEFFQNHPQLIGLSGDLPEPGSFITLDDFGTPILATRDKQGEFHAFLNACRHRSVKVASDERGKKSVFMCPFHNWSYANTGDLISIPDQDHFGPIDKSCNGLLELPAVERDGLLWVHPQVDGRLDIDDLLGELAQELGSFNMASLGHAGATTIDMKLNWKFANDTFGETYHFGKLHKNTLGQLYFGNNLHLQEFGRHHRFVTANKGLDAIRERPESEWKISQGTFVLYHLFPNIQLIVNEESVTLVRIYPDENNPGRSVTKVSFYFAPELAALAKNATNEPLSTEAVYNFEERKAAEGAASLSASLEVFRSTIEHEDYAMGEMQQRAAENGQLKEIQFGRNEPALHHFHQNYREALGLPKLEPIAPATTS